MKKHHQVSRRKFLASFSTLAVAGSFCGIAIAEEPTAAKLTEDDPMSVALGYKHDASQVDVAKYPQRVANENVEQTCANCTLFLNADTPDAEWAPCSIFQNRLVASKGWCATWIARPAG